MKETRKEHVQARVTPTVLEAVRKAAEREGVSLSLFVHRTLEDRVQGEETRQKDEVQD